VAWRRKEDSEKIVDTLNVLELITATLQRALGNAAPLALKSVCRACIMLGRFVVNRPRSDTATIGAKSSSAALQSSDAFFGLLAPAPYAENVPSSTAQEVIRVGSKERFDTIRRLNDLMMDVSSAFQSKSAHVKCEALKAVLWLAPEVEAEDEDEAKSNVWSWIQRRLEESRSALSEGRQFDRSLVLRFTSCIVHCRASWRSDASRVWPHERDSFLQCSNAEAGVTHGRSFLQERTFRVIVWCTSAGGYTWAFKHELACPCVFLTAKLICSSVLGHGRDLWAYCC
jgi:hypothetical protein